MPARVPMLGWIVVCSLFFGFVSPNKVCTNSGVNSHTSRYELFLSSQNASWEGQHLNHLRLIPYDDHARSNSNPRKMLGEDETSLLTVYKKIKNSSGVGGFGAGFLKEISLHNVRLHPSSVHGVAQLTNLKYLLMLDVDRLAWSFRKTARLEALSDPYGGWEAPNIELRGHFVGHYLSASAQMWASTHNARLKEKMSALVSSLSDCQTKISTGYLSAFPSELFDRFEALEEVWAPYYTIHKILAGLLDQYTLAGDSRALEMATWMADYFYKRVQNVISTYTIERHWLSLNEETGGMNDVLYRLYIITGDRKHLLLAHLFDKPCFLGLLALKADDISGFHANTHIPIVIGAQLRYEITREPLYREIGTFFFDIVNSSHSYATGGTSVDEFWSDPKRLASTLQTENQESCTTYNMLKVARHLFRWTKEMAYADYYERALTNGVLGIQRGTEPGVMIYMLPLRAGGSKARGYHGWGKKFDSFWCCYGTGIESFSKLGDSIYFEEGTDLILYIIQYIPSTVDWINGDIVLTQEVEPLVSWDQRLRVTITISPKRQAERLSSSLKLRIPLWTNSNGSKASLNGELLFRQVPGQFLSINKSWSHGDEITLDLPLLLRSEPIQDDRTQFTSMRALLYGPYLLAGLSSGELDIEIQPDTPLSDCFTPIPADYNPRLISLAQDFDNSTFFLNQTLQMDEQPEPGTDAAIRATFRLVDHSEPEKLVKLELFDFPGTFLSVDGGMESSYIFRLVDGLDGRNGTVSLESGKETGCFMHSGLAGGRGGGVGLRCSAGGPPDGGFRRGASFWLERGISQYDEASFVGKGAKRNFVMVPLFSLRDESYTVYFNQG